MLGYAVVGTGVGLTVGGVVGSLGCNEGRVVGYPDGELVGCNEGTLVGCEVGCEEGSLLG